MCLVFFLASISIQDQISCGVKKDLGFSRYSLFIFLNLLFYWDTWSLEHIFVCLQPSSETDETKEETRQLGEFDVNKDDPF